MAKARRKKAAKKKMGRPRLRLNWSQIGRMCEVQMTGVEIARVLGCHYDAIAKRCKSDNGLTFSEWSEEKREHGRRSLRRRQYKSAVTDGNVTMMIWLGKQWLDQTDKREVNTTIDQSIEVRDVREYTNDELDASIARLEKLVAKEGADGTVG